MPADSDGMSVVRPFYVSLGNRRLGRISTFHATQSSFERAAERAIRRLHEPPDLIYGHFLYESGAAAVRIGKKLGIPSVVAVGDSSFAVVDRWVGTERAKEDFRDVDGMIAVSTILKKGLSSEFDIPSSKIDVFPNGVDLGTFFPRDRAAMREKYGLPADQFLIAFVGHFCHRKGTQRVAEAIKGMDDVGAIYIGAGPDVPDASQSRFQGTVPHDLLPELLSAADIFVLPTLAEGSCNAILEAMACGLPVVSSDGAFNDDIVDEHVAIRTDPLDTGAIREAIRTLKDDSPLRDRMASMAVEHTKRFDINDRAARILAWLNDRIATYRSSGPNESATPSATT